MPTTGKGRESESPEFCSETLTKALRCAAVKSFFQFTNVRKREFECLHVCKLAPCKFMGVRKERASPVPAAAVIPALQVIIRN